MACDNNNTVSDSTSSNVHVVEGKPDYSSKTLSNVLRIGAWVAPTPGNWGGKGNEDFITESAYKDVKESGINHIYALYENANITAINKATTYAASNGIKYLARDTNFDVDPELLELEPGDFQKSASSYADSEGFAGHLITDEPGASKFIKLGKLKKYYEKEFPGKEFYVNLFPTYASLAQIECNSYEEYIDQFIAYVNPDFISYDHYALSVDGYGKYKITEDVLYNLELVATKCKEANIPMYTFAQSMSYDSTSRCPNEAEVRWQVMTELAYGSKSIQYFCYWTPLEFADDVGSSAMITKDGQKTDQYYAVQAVNQELLAMDEAYLDFDWKGTMLVNGSTVTQKNKAFRQVQYALESHEMIKEINASQDTLVGTFKDGDGRSGFLISNFSDPAYKLKDTITVKFNNATKALIYHYGDSSYVDLENGVLNYSLDEGDGIFVIPYR